MKYFLILCILVNELNDISVHSDPSTKTAIVDIKVNDKEESVVLSPLTVDLLLENLKLVRSKMSELVNSPYNQ